MCRKRNSKFGGNGELVIPEKKDLQKLQTLMQRLQKDVNGN